MELQELLALNAEGFIPGPGETSEAFLKRVQETKNFFRSQEWIPLHHWEMPAEKLKVLFNFSPRWCAATYSAKGLTPWQAAATWIDVKRIYKIQVRSSRWLSWLVNSQELLAHEAAHAARAAFDEPKYEELFAFLTSTSRWRRVLGPLFRKPVEAAWLVGLLGIGLVVQMVEIWAGVDLFSQLWFVAALCRCSFWSIRLARARRCLAKAAKKLAPYLKDPAMVRFVLFRMTDAEIEEWAGHSSVEPGADLRWQLIRTAYWKETCDAAH